MSWRQSARGLSETSDSINQTEPFETLRSHKPAQNQIYFFEKEMAQAQVRLEFAAGTYDEKEMPAISNLQRVFWWRNGRTCISGT